MIELKKIINSLDKTIKDSDLHNITIGLSETFIDSFIDDGICKDIPIIGSIVGVGKVALGVRERLFLKKIIYFISELKNIPQSKRHQMIDEIDSSQKYRIKVGEKLLYIIEKCEDHEKSRIIAYLFSAFLEGILTYGEFLRSANVTEKILTEDLIQFVNDDFDSEILIDSQEYLSSGLVLFKLYEKMDWKDERDPNELQADISAIGLKIKNVLKNKFTN